MKIEFTWTIKNFTYLYYKDEAPKLSFLQSANFPTDPKQNLPTFAIRLFPRGIKDEKLISLSLLRQSGHDKEVPLSFKLAILDRRRKECNIQDRTNIVTQDCEFMYDEFISRENLTRGENGYLPNEVLTVYCEVKLQCNSQEDCIKLQQKDVTNAEVEVTPLKDQWEIKQFESCRDCANHSDISLSSRKFFQQNRHHNCFLRLWLNDGDEEDQHLSVYFYLLSEHTNCQQQTRAQYKLSLIDFKQQKSFTKFMQQQIVCGNEFGFHKFISLEQLLDQNNQLLDKGILKIHFEIDLIGKEIEENCEILNIGIQQHSNRAHISNLNNNHQEENVKKDDKSPVSILNSTIHNFVLSNGNTISNEGFQMCN